MSSVEEQFGRSVREELSEFPVNQDVRPTQRTPIIRWLTKERPSVVSARWGFIPQIARTSQIDLTFQTDIEFVQTDVRWRYAWRYSRCLIPATAWYENQLTTDETLGHNSGDIFHDTSSPRSLKVAEASGKIMMLAGLHGFLTTEHGHRDTISVVTHKVSNGIDRVQQQIPCVVGRAAWKIWLSPAVTDPHKVAGYLEQPETRIGVSTII